MRKLLFAGLFLLIAVVIFGQIQKSDSLKMFFYDKPIRTTIKTNPLAYIVGPIVLTAEYRFALEFKIAKKQSFQIGNSYLGKSIYLSIIENIDSSFSLNNFKFIINGYRFQFTYKLYLDYHDSPQGFYVAPHFSYSYAKFTSNQNNQYAEYLEAKYINYNIVAGYQLILNDIFVLETYSGFGIKNNSWEEIYNNQRTLMSDDDFVIIKSNIKFIFGFNLGIAF